MDSEKKEMILMEIKERLGKIDEATTTIKSDIAELKQKDISQSKALEEAYGKAKARQDSIRDDLQHQIDNTQHLIEIINDNFSKSITSMNQNFSETIKTFSDTTVSLIKNFNEESKKTIENQNKKIETLATKKEKSLLRWFDFTLDKLITIGIIGAIVILFQKCNAPKEFLNQLPH